MEFTGGQLISILEQQWPACGVEIVSETITPRVSVSPATAAEMVADARTAFVGVGHHKRILYLKPRVLGLWRGRKTVVRERREDGVYLGGKTAPGRLNSSGRPARPALDVAIRFVGDNVRHGGPDPAWTLKPASFDAVKPQLSFRPPRGLVTEKVHRVFGQLLGDARLEQDKLY